MIRKLKCWLPTVQVILAAALLLISDLWTSALTKRIHGTVGSVPTFDFLVSLNAPVSLARTYWGHFINGWWDYFVFVIFVGLFWYWVALNILSWRRARAVTLFHYRPLRVAADLALTAVGIFIGLVFITNYYWPIFVLGLRIPEMHSGITGWFGYTVVTLLTFPMAMWSVLLVSLFTRDGYLTLRHQPATDLTADRWR